MKIDKELLESLRGKSREERLAYFNEHKSELLDKDLSAVNGGKAGMSPDMQNPDSDVPDPGGAYYSSWWFVCEGEFICNDRIDA